MGELSVGGWDRVGWVALLITSSRRKTNERTLVGLSMDSTFGGREGCSLLLDGLLLLVRTIGGEERAMLVCTL